MTNGSMKLTFWGVRGSIPITRSDVLKYGGNTPCIEIDAGEHLLIIDAGSGIHQLGNKLSSFNHKITTHLLISHVHWDHIQGFPFFMPAFVEGNTIHIYGEQKGDLHIKDQLAGMMKDPYWPIGLDMMKANLIFHALAVGDTLSLNQDLRVTTMQGNHPGGTMLYHIAFKDKSISYISDYEHQGETDTKLIEFVRGTDILIYDAFYTDDEYHGTNGKISKRGWGHSTWQEGCKLAQLAEVKQLFLFHHDINRTDTELEQIELEARRVFPNTHAAREGVTIHICDP